MRDFIDAHRGTFGVEPICKVLRIAPSGYRRYAAQQRDPGLRSARARRDDELAPQIKRVWQVNMQVYGADKVWRQLAREGTIIARCTVERLMRRQAIRGVMRGKVVRTTLGDNKAPCPLDRVNRQFRAERPNPLWVSDFTYVSTWPSSPPWNGSPGLTTKGCWNRLATFLRSKLRQTAIASSPLTTNRRTACSRSVKVRSCAFKELI